MMAASAFGPFVFEEAAAAQRVAAGRQVLSARM